MGVMDANLESAEGQNPSVHNIWSNTLQRGLYSYGKEWNLLCLALGVFPFKPETILVEMTLELPYHPFYNY